MTGDLKPTPVVRYETAVEMAAAFPEPGDHYQASFEGGTATPPEMKGVHQVLYGRRMVALEGFVPRKRLGLGPKDLTQWIESGGCEGDRGSLTPVEGIKCRALR